MRALMMGVVLSVIVASASFADVITKTDGNAIKGTIIGEEDGRWIIDLGYGRVMIAKDEIASVTREDTEAITAESAQPDKSAAVDVQREPFKIKNFLKGLLGDVTRETDQPAIKPSLQSSKLASGVMSFKSKKESLIVNILFWIVGYLLYSNLVYLIFRIVDDEKKYSTAHIYTAISLFFLYISSFFVFSQIYFTLANIMLVYFLYSFGAPKAFLFGLFFTWVAQVSQIIFFDFPK